MLASVSRRSLAQQRRSCLTTTVSTPSTLCAVVQSRSYRMHAAASSVPIMMMNRTSPTSTVSSLSSTNTTLTQQSSSSMMMRAFSSNGSYGGTPAGPLRSQPQYAIFGEKTMLSIKMLPPTFKCLKNGSLVLDQNKKGRILLEWSARGDGGSFDRDSQIRFGLSPEEVGFLLQQLPDNEVEFVRRLPADQPGLSAADMPEKVLRITPGEGGQFAFKIDYEKDAVGGQRVSGSTEALGPLEVVAQLGEYVVMRKLMEQSIPSLIGWDVQTNFAIQNAMNLALQAGSNNNYNNNSVPRARPVAQQQQQQSAAVPTEDVAVSDL